MTSPCKNFVLQYLQVTAKGPKGELIPQVEACLYYSLITSMIPLNRISMVHISNDAHRYRIYRMTVDLVWTTYY